MQRRAIPHTVLVSALLAAALAVGCQSTPSETEANPEMARAHRLPGYEARSPVGGSPMAYLAPPGVPDAKEIERRARRNPSTPFVTLDHSDSTGPRPLAYGASKGYATVSPEAMQSALRKGDASAAALYNTDSPELLSKLGYQALRRGAYQPAFKHFPNAIVRHRRRGDEVALARDLHNAGIAALQLDKSVQAADLFSEAAPILERIGATIPAIEAFYGATLASARSHRFAAMESALDDTLRLLERATATLPDPAYRGAFRRRVRHIYDDFLRLLDDLHTDQPSRGYAERAFDVFEQRQARTLLADIGAAFADRAAGGASGLLQRERDARRRVDEAERRLLEAWTSTSMERQHAAIQELTVAVEKARRDLQDTKLRLARQAPEVHALRFPPVRDLSELRRTLLGPKTALLAYAVLPDRVLIWGFDVRRSAYASARVSPHQLQGKIAVLRERWSVDPASVRNVAKRGLIAVRPSAAAGSAIPQESRVLGKLLLPPPISDLARSAELLYVIPSGPVYGLPLEALPPAGSGTEYLVRQTAMSYGVSASLIAHLRDRIRHDGRAARPFLAFADPLYRAPLSRQPGLELSALPDTRDEAQAIAAVLGVTGDPEALNFGASASVSRLLALNRTGRLRQYRHLLFATHGLLTGDGDELEPQLVLTHPDPNGRSGTLDPGDIYRLRLNADVVALTACNSGQGQVIDGEGIAGMTRAFMHAGADNVAVTLWSVESRSTKYLSVGMFSYLSDTRSLALALRRSKLDLIDGRHGELFRHPRYWASLVSFGPDL